MITALALTLTVFLLLMALYVLKTAREPLVLLHGGAEVKSYAAAGQSLLLLAGLPAYGALARRVTRMRPIAGIYGFFALNVVSARLSLLIAGAWLSIASSARSQAPLEQAPQPGPEPRCRTVRCVREPESGDDDIALLLARAPLAPVRLLFRTSTELLLIVPRIEDEHHVSRRVQDVFFDDTRTFGLYPTAFFETGFEPNVGARMVHRNLFGRREQLQMRAGFGGLENQLYRADLRSGARWSPLELSLDLRFNQHDGHHFYGLGNADLSDAGALVAPQSPTEISVEGEYGKQELFARGGAAWNVGAVGIAFSQLWRRRALSAEVDDDARSVAEVYAGESVSVFDRALVDVYDELRVAWDGQRRRRANSPSALPSSGVKLTAWSGLQHELSTPRMSFGRIGLDVQPLADLYHGDRVLRLRVRTAWVVGPLDRIPFLDLPQLGGASLLRGY
ncbi:MAG TPA: hypothetical protein VK509_18470, partial [Polyangiales bacterium]|nr:hypothetical protein [Polyangiales bacterium]